MAKTGDGSTVDANGRARAQRGAFGGRRLGHDQRAARERDLHATQRPQEAHGDDMRRRAGLRREPDRLGSNQGRDPTRSGRALEERHALPDELDRAVADRARAGS